MLPRAFRIRSLPDSSLPLRNTTDVRFSRIGHAGCGEAYQSVRFSRIGHSGAMWICLWMTRVLLQCLFSRLISIFPQCGRMVFPGLVIMQSVM